MHSLDSQTTAVTVYPDRARITRQGQVTLQPGIQTLELSNLPIRLLPDSIRAIARGTAQARLMGVQAQRTFYAETPQDQIRELEQQIEIISDQIHIFEARIASLEENRKALTALLAETKTYALALSAGEIEVDAQLKLFDSLRAQADKLADEQQAIAIQKRVSERQLQKLQNELNLRRKSPRREFYAARIEVEILKAGDLQIELTYVVMNAGWQPLYDLRLIQQADPKTVLEVAYLAQISQTTGEDWQDVVLTLSTARPGLTGAAPELDPWYIRPMPQPVDRARSVKYSRAPDDMAEIAAVAMAAPPPQAAPVEEVYATVDSSGTTVTYQVPGTFVIPADGAPHKVVVTRIGLEPELDYVSAPKLIQAVYRRAKLENDSRYTLLPGKANIYVNEEYIGGSELDLTAPDGMIELYLGVDDRIKVERELKRRDVDKRLLGGKRRIQYGYQIEIENTLPEVVHLMIQDQIPVSGHEDIKVKLENTVPKPDRQTELNILEWDLTLASKTQKNLRFDFSVEFPQDLAVSGLP